MVSDFELDEIKGTQYFRHFCCWRAIDKVEEAVEEGWAHHQHLLDHNNANEIPRLSTRADKKRALQIALLLHMPSVIMTARWKILKKLRKLLFHFFIFHLKSFQVICTLDMSIIV